MIDNARVLEMQFDGTATDRRKFLREIREKVMALTGESMALDSLIHEIAKNIFDHAQGLGKLRIESKNGSFQFLIFDNGTECYDFEKCSAHSRLSGNGVNLGIGLKIIQDLARDLKIDIKIDTSKGFSYSGIYYPQKPD